ncbi:MAG: thioredoxin-like domain-containing protein [Chitinophagaceae bacterium]|nr:thioredoxin-like domain-containing protein [Chitinophagaceae bacterium]
MKKSFVFLFFVISVAVPAASQNGYEIKVTLKPFKNRYIYLGHYYGKTFPIVDSAMLNEKSEAVFKGDKKLNGGIYLIGYPDKNGYFELLIDKNQHFSIIADTSDLENSLQFIHSPENRLFKDYQKEMAVLGRTIQALRESLKTAKHQKDSASIQEEIAKYDEDIRKYREQIITQHPETLLATFLKAMKEPELPDSLKYPKTASDSLASYQYYKNNFWKDVNFWDGRLAYTPFFENKVEKYFEQLVPLHPDSVIREIDWMMGYASINEEMTKLLLVKFVNRYIQPKYMWDDAVFVHLYEKYFANKNYPWLTEKGKKIIQDRAYSVMANLVGNPAADIFLPDTAGKINSLYSLQSPYTVVVFWDPRCSHCQQIIPKMDSLYHARWKQHGVKIFAVAKETDGTRKDWLEFILKHRLSAWHHVFYSKAEEKTRVENGIPGYSQLYDVQSFPTLYLLDKDKKIIAKKLALEQIDEILQLRLRQ